MEPQAAQVLNETVNGVAAAVAVARSFASLEEILNRDSQELTALAVGEFETEKLGLVPFTALSHSEYKKMKNDCFQMVPNGTGGMVPELDDDKLMIKAIVTAVDKDQRSTFTFANKALMDKLGVVTAEMAVTKLLSPGEIYKMAIAVQNVSGFGEKAVKETKEAIKNY